jgi:hypothetical protein
MPPFKKYYFILPLFIYAISSFIFFQKFQHYFSPDLISYITVSEKIIQGNFYDAINGYWSPLISWLLVPLLFFIKNGVLCFQLLNMLLGIGILYTMHRLIQHYSKNIILHQVTLTAIALLIPAFALLNLTSDILFTAVLLLYFYWHTQSKIYTSIFRIAFIGTLLYLSKAYGFYFFIAHLLIYFIVSKQYTIKYSISIVVKGVLLFILSSGIWVLLLSTKYQSFTISTAATYNKALLTETGTIQHPCDTMRLIAPLKSYTYTAWEEMYLHTQLQLSQKKTSISTAVLLKKNIHAQFNLYNKTSRYGFLLAIALALLTLGIRKMAWKTLLLPISLFLIFSAGYLFLFNEERYLFFPILVLITIHTLLSNALADNNKSVLYLLCICISYSIGRSAYDIYRTTNKTEEAITHTIAKQIATNNPTNYATYAPYQLANLAYLNQWKNYGGIAAYKQDSMALMQDLDKYSIDCLILPDSISLPTNIRSQYIKMVLPTTTGFQVWKRNN